MQIRTCRLPGPVSDLTETRRFILQDWSTFLRNDVARRAYLARQTLALWRRRIAFTRPQQRGNEQLADQKYGYGP